jgi:hypothetical protein
VLDYVVIVGVASRADRVTQYMAEYFTELALLHTELSVYSFGRLAASCHLLARLTLRRGLLNLLYKGLITHLLTYIRALHVEL